MNTTAPIDATPVPDSDALIAAEYVLGLLDAGTRREAQARVIHDAAFATEVDTWETHFTPWLDAIPPVDAPAMLWARIHDVLWHHELPARGAAAAAVAAPSLWSRLALWRGLAFGGFAVAAVSLAALFVALNLPPPPVPAPRIVTFESPPAAPRVTQASMVLSLRHDDGTMAYTATVDPDTGVITLIPASVPNGARVPELWMIDAGGTPHSLGVVARDRAMRVVMPRQFLSETKPDTSFAVSLEPAGGSPSGSPTGPVVASGKLIRL